jgi:hypothetical protein
MIEHKKFEFLWKTFSRKDENGKTEKLKNLSAGENAINKNIQT